MIRETWYECIVFRHPDKQLLFAKSGAFPALCQGASPGPQWRRRRAIAVLQGIRLYRLGAEPLRKRHKLGHSVWVIARSERANEADAAEAGF